MLVDEVPSVVDGDGDRQGQVAAVSGENADLPQRIGDEEVYSASSSFVLAEGRTRHHLKRNAGILDYFGLVVEVTLGRGA